jgi:diguanylate cyclase (GGDEF)-like protein
MKRLRISRLNAYVATVCLAGAAALVWVSTEHRVGSALRGPTYWVLLAFIFLGEVRPIRLLRGTSGGEITISTPFLFALLMKFGLAATMWGVAAACFAADVTHRKPVIRALFNAAQYTLSIAAAGLTIQLLSGGRELMEEPQLALADLGILLAGGAVFFVLNVALPSTALALHQGVAPLRLMRRDLAYQLATAGVLIAASPVTVVTSHHSLLLLPTLLLPAVAVYWSSRVSLQNEHQSLHDSLTGLPNRVLLHNRISEAMAGADLVSVMLLDLDHFKEVNDTLGHRTGDRLLVQVGHRLTEVIGSQGLVARLGGDEFALVMTHPTDRDEVARTARTVIERLQAPFEVDDYVLSVEASVGVALYPDHGRDFDTLLRCADVAMYNAKSARLGSQLYEPGNDRNSAERLALIGEIRRAIDCHELVLHYQPKIDVHLDRVVGGEALVRWMHPERGMLPPGEFVPHIERTVHVSAFTMYVIEKAARQFKTWAAEGVHVPIAVNVPVTCLHDATFPARVHALLTSLEVPAEAIEFEITETTIMADPVRAMAVLEELESMGITLSVDDFGTGYSSLTYLKQMPVRTIKIDKSFVTHIATDAEDRTIANSTVTLAHSLGLVTVAEGVEDAAALQVLRDIGCEQAQGYHIARPMPPEDFYRWVADRTRQHTAALNEWVAALDTPADSLMTATGERQS